jgi:hypothetical protein
LPLLAWAGTNPIFFLPIGIGLGVAWDAKPFTFSSSTLRSSDQDLLCNS